MKVAWQRESEQATATDRQTPIHIRSMNDARVITWSEMLKIAFMFHSFAIV